MILWSAVTKTVAEHCESQEAAEPQSKPIRITNNFFSQEESMILI